MVNTFIAEGARIAFHGWERLNGEAKEFAWRAPAVSEATILRGGGYASKRARAMYPLWMIAVFLRTLSLGQRQTIFCLGWETAFPALIAARFTKSLIIFDDADRFSLLFKLPRLLNHMLQRLEHWASREAWIHIVPGFSRYEWRSDNMLALRNTPLRKDFEAARAKNGCTRESRLVIYANGWLGETRGAPIFLALAERLRSKDLPVQIVIAGRVDSAAGEALIAHPLVSYHGELDQLDALALYVDSDVVLTYYDPAIPINRKAESNKWGDCVYFGVPFIVNSEVETAESLVNAGAAFAAPYHDIDALENLISQLMDDRRLIEAASARLAGFKADYPVFDAQLINLLGLLREHQHAID